MFSTVLIVSAIYSQQQQQQKKTTTFINSNHLQSNDTWVYRVQNIKYRINIRSVTWMSMLFEGGNPSLIPKYCQVETDYKCIYNLKK